MRNFWVSREEMWEAWAVDEWVWRVSAWLLERVFRVRASSRSRLLGYGLVRGFGRMRKGIGTF